MVQVPAAASTIYGDRLAVAELFHSILATDGIDHGLIGPREVPRLWERHILNCAVIGEKIDPESAVVDVGSGAGLPGIALAIARPDLRVTLVEPLLRRCSFLERSVTTLGIDIRVIRGRAEERSVIDEVGGADVVTSRAVAPLDRLSRWSGPLIREGGRMVAIKGSSATEEIARDSAAAARAGVVDLRVESCGEDVLPSPTTVVIGVRDGSGRGGRPAKKKRRSR